MKPADTIHTDAPVLRADAFYPADVEIRLSRKPGKTIWRICYFNTEVARGEARNHEDGLKIAQAAADEWEAAEIRNLLPTDMEDMEDMECVE